METKKVVIGLFGLAIVGGVAYYVYQKHKDEKSKVAKIAVTADNPVLTTPAPEAPVNKPAATAGSGKAPAPKPAAVKSPVDMPMKPLSADALIQQKGENAVIGKMLVAKSNGAGIYSTTMQKVSQTNVGEKLGKAFKANRMKNGTYMVKYQNTAGGYNVVASSSVNVI